MDHPLVRLTGTILTIAVIYIAMHVAVSAGKDIGYRTAVAEADDDCVRSP